MQKFRLALLLPALTLSLRLFSQDLHVPDSLPKTKEDYAATEPFVINAISWLENTPIDQQPDLRRACNAYLIAWVSGSPTVTINLDPKIVPMDKDNPPLLLAFMNGWTRYSLQHNHTNDPVQCNVAGLQSLLRVYNANAGHGIKKSKEVGKLSDLDQKGGLEQWVKDKLGIK